MVDRTGGTSEALGRCENSVRPLTTLKTQQQKEGKQQKIREPTDAEWQTLIDGLNKVAGDLSKDKEGEKHQERISELTRQVHTLWTRSSQKEDPAQNQLSRIEEKLDNLAAGGGSMKQAQLNMRGGQGSMNQTWAGVAAQGIRQAVEPLSQRTAVRVRLPDSKGKSPTELLAAASLFLNFTEHFTEFFLPLLLSLLPPVVPSLKDRTIY